MHIPQLLLMVSLMAPACCLKEESIEVSAPTCRSRFTGCNGLASEGPAPFWLPRFLYRFIMDSGEKISLSSCSATPLGFQQHSTALSAQGGLEERWKGVLGDSSKPHIQLESLGDLPVSVFPLRKVSMLDTLMQEARWTVEKDRYTRFTLWFYHLQLLDLVPLSQRL